MAYYKVSFDRSHTPEIVIEATYYGIEDGWVRMYKKTSDGPATDQVFSAPSGNILFIKQVSE